MDYNALGRERKEITMYSEKEGLEFQRNFSNHLRDMGGTIGDTLTQDQLIMIHSWAEQNSVIVDTCFYDDLIITVSGVGHCSGEKVGRLDLNLVNEKALKDKYKKECLQGFKQFIKNKVDKSERI